MKITRNSKIAIIGAGPAGTHMAYLLRQKGFTDVTIYEKNNRIGGKSLTVMHDDVPHDMGTCYITASYNRIMSLMQEVGMTDTVELSPDMRHAFTDGDLMKTQHYVPRLMVDVWAQNSLNPIVKGAYAMKTFFDKIPILGSPFSFVLGNSLQYRAVQDLVGAIREYMHYMDDLRENSQHDVPNVTYDKFHYVFAESIAKFLQERGWSVMQPVFTMLYTVMCYGYVDTSTAYYGTYWMSKPYLQTYLNFLTGKQAHNSSVMLKKGFQPLWERTAELAECKIIYNAKIKSISRKKGISIKHEDGKVDKFDFLISAIPAPDMIKLLEEPTEKEQEVFSKMIHSIVVTSLIEVESEYQKAGVIYWINRLCPAKEHLVYATRTAASILQNRHSEKQTCVAYQYYDNPDVYDEEISKAKLIESFNNTGITVKNTMQREVWKYFYRFPAEAIQTKIPWEIDDIQCHNNSLYIGSSVCFESVNAVVNYNYYAYDKYIKRLLYIN